MLIGTAMTMDHPVSCYSISLPDYTGEQTPDRVAIGARLDSLIERHFAGWIAIRGIGLVKILR
jgi:hypothetical protein